MDDTSDIELLMSVAEDEGAAVSWSDCARCGRPRDEHLSPSRLCPATPVMGAFHVRDAFFIEGRGWTVSGTCVDGQFTLGDVVRRATTDREYTVIGLERAVKDLGSPIKPGETAGLLLREMVDYEEVPPGTILVH